MSSMSHVYVLISDGHEEVRQSAELLINAEPDLSVCALAASGPELIELAKRHRPKVIAGDLHLPDFDPAERIRELKKELPAAELVIFADERTERVVGQLFAAGAKSLIRTDEAPQFLVAAIRAAAQGKTFLTPTVSNILFARFLEKGARIDQPDRSKLTSREREIIELICDGKTNKAIGSGLEISTRTVETHRAAVMRKVGVSSTAHLVRYAIRNGLIEA